MNNNKPNLTDQVKEKSKQVMNTVKNSMSRAKETLNQKVSNVGKQISEVKQKIEENPIKKASNAPISMITQFTESNTAITKFVFIILILIGFIFFFQVGTSFLQMFFGANPNPILLRGMIPSNKMKVIPSNPNVNNAVPIYRSTNEDQGLEFTWNVWFYVDSLNPTSNYQRVFSKGNPPNGLNLSPNVDPNLVVVSPGLFITQNTDTNSVLGQPAGSVDANHANLLLVMNTFQPGSSSTEYAESITIRNIPIQKWVNCTIRVQNTTVDLYINGVMTQRKTLNNLPRQNYYDTYVGDTNNGFNGYVSALRYYSRAIGYEEIQTIYGSGPNLQLLDSAGANGKDYLSMSWYYNLPSPSA
jgi:hypothetical protein